MPRSRPSTALTAGEHAVLSRRFRVVPCHERDAVEVLDLLTCDRISVTKFQREFGVRGTLWLFSAPPHVADSTAHADHDIPLPTKNPWRCRNATARA